MTNGVTTKVDWGSRPDGAEEKYRKGMERYAYLKDPKYSHKLEQFFLMVRQGFSGKFVNSFFEKDNNIISTDLDLMRCIALVAGEDFVIDYLYKNEFSLEEAITLLQDHLCKEKYKQFPQVEDLLRENERLQERFQLQMDFLQKERENVRSYHDEILQGERKKQEIELELLRTRLEQQCDNYIEKLNRAQEENQRLQEELQQARMDQEEEINKEREVLLAQCEEIKRQIIHPDGQADVTESDKRPGGLWGLLQRKEEQKIRKQKSERNRFIMETIKNPDYSVEQLKIILHAISEDFSLEELQQICAPKIPIKNMETLELYFQKGRKENVSFMTPEE